MKPLWAIFLSAIGDTHILFVDDNGSPLDKALFSNANGSVSRDANGFNITRTTGMFRVCATDFNGSSFETLGVAVRNDIRMITFLF